MDGKTWLKVQSGLQEAMVAFDFAMKGALKAESDELRGKIAEWDKRQNLDQRAEAVSAMEAQLAANVKAHDENVASEMSELTKKSDSVKAQEAALAQAIAKLADEKRLFASEMASREQALDGMRAALKQATDEANSRMAEADSIKAALHVREQAMADREAKVKATLAQLSE
jgi:chromosome segregation ATPase